jgi:transaldolase
MRKVCLLFVIEALNMKCIMCAEEWIAWRACCERELSCHVSPYSLWCNSDAIVNRVHILREMYKENKTSLSKVLFTIPATWDGLQAVKQLESEGIECHVTHCYRYVSRIAYAHVVLSSNRRWSNLVVIARHCMIPSP